LLQTTFSASELKASPKSPSHPDRVTNWREFFTNVHAVLQKHCLCPVY